MKTARYMTISLILLPLWGCLSSTDEPPAGAEQEGSSVLEAQLSGTAKATITFINAVDVISSGASFAGFMTPTPLASVPAGHGDLYVETGIGNVTSFGINYTAGGKKCHFDSAAFPGGGTILTPPFCMFTKNAQSQGSTFATCTATVTAVDLTTCSQSVTFSMQ